MGIPTVVSRGRLAIFDTLTHNPVQEVEGLSKQVKS